MRKFLTSVIVALALVTGGIVTAAPAQATVGFKSTVYSELNSTSYLTVLSEFKGAHTFALVDEAQHGEASLTANGALTYEAPAVPHGMTTALTDQFRASAIALDGNPFVFQITYTVQHRSQVDISSSQTVAELGTPIEFTAQASSTGPELSGDVRFDWYPNSDSTREVLGTAATNEQGMATLETAALPLGTHAVSVTFHGNNNVAPSASGFGSITIIQAPAQAPTVTSLHTPPGNYVIGDTATPRHSPPP